MTASDIWGKVDGRLAEAAADSIGFETAIGWALAIKTITLLFICTFGVVLSAYSLSYTADELISYLGEYDDNTKTEGDEKTDSSADDADGTSAQWDIGITHLVTTFYAYFVFTWIAYGGYTFFAFYNPLDDTVQCDDISSTNFIIKYDGIQDIISQMKDYDSCMAVIDDIHKRLDVNGNGIIDRCEDVRF